MPTRFIFLADIDETYKDFANRDYDFVPRLGECVHINHYYHRVEEVVWDADDGGRALVYLGQSSDNPGFACRSDLADVEERKTQLPLK